MKDSKSTEYATCTNTFLQIKSGYKIE